jgi:hypothetical protein
LAGALEVKFTVTGLAATPPSITVPVTADAPSAACAGTDSVIGFAGQRRRDDDIVDRESHPRARQIVRLVEPNPELRAVKEAPRRDAASSRLTVNWLQLLPSVRRAQRLDFRTSLSHPS